MRPEEMTKSQCCKWQGKWIMMLMCMPKLGWEQLLNWLMKQQYDEYSIVGEFIKDLNKNLKNYDKAGSKK